MTETSDKQTKDESAETNAAESNAAESNAAESRADDSGAIAATDATSAGGKTSESDVAPESGDDVAQETAAGDAAEGTPTEDSAAEETAAAEPDSDGSKAAAYVGTEASRRRAAQLEAEFLGTPSGFEPGAPIPADYVDPDLESLSAETSVIQMLLVLIVGAMSIWFLTIYTAELAYFFTPNEPISLGYADELQERPELWVDGQLQLESNRYVDVHGAADLPSNNGQFVYYKLLGAPIYAQGADRVDQSAMGQFNSIPRDEESWQPNHDDGGRLLRFQDLPKRYHSLVRHYSDNFAVVFCGYPASHSVERYLHNREGRIQLALIDELGRNPTQEEIDERMGDEAECQQAYMLISGIAPKDHWYFLPIYFSLFGIAFFSLWYVGRAARRRFAS